MSEYKYYIVKRTKVEEILVKLKADDPKSIAEEAADQVSSMSQADEIETVEVCEDKWPHRTIFDEFVDWSEE